MSKEEIIKWTCTSTNSGNCAECPYNEGFSEWPGNRLPCGQFHCWVDLHCEECDTMEQGDALEEKEENTMKKYMVKTEYADQIFGGECDTAYVEECMQNGMPEEDVMHLVREFGEAVLDQFDIEEV